MPTARADFLDAIADTYAAKPVDDPEAFERKITLTRALLTPDATVLDVGCGTGSLALRLADAAAWVHGLDVSPAMIRIARAKAAEQAVGNVTFHVGALDASFDALGPGSVDVVCACSLLHLLADRPESLRRVHELLVPGGVFVSSTVCLGDGWIPYRPVLAVMRWLGKAPPVACLRRRTLEAELTGAGFGDVVQHDVGAQPNIAFIVARKSM